MKISSPLAQTTASELSRARESGLRKPSREVHVESYAHPRTDPSAQALTKYLYGIVREQCQKIVRNSIERLRQHVFSKARFSDEAFAEIEAHLLKRGLQFLLPSVATKCGVLREAVLECAEGHYGVGTNYSQQFRCATLNFDSDRHLEKMAQSAISLSERNLVKAIDRLIAVQDILRQRCGIDMTKIASIQIPYADTHNGGAQPIIFADKHVRIVYKPVDLRAQSLLRALSHSIFKQEGFYSPGIPEVFYSDRHYGVMEYVQLSNNSVRPQDYEQHYHKFGLLLALAHCFKVVDLHQENVFITQDGPVLLDIETIFYPPSLDGLASATVEDTLLIGAKEVSGIEGGGLLNDIGVYAGHSDNCLKINYVKKSLRTNNRIVASANGHLVKPAEFEKQIIDGFSAGYDKIRRDKDMLFSKVREMMRLNIACRYIARPTRYYAVKQLLCIQPKITATHTYLRTIKCRLLADIPQKYRAKFAALVGHEFSDLLSGDIPYFYTTTLSRHLYHRGRIAKNNFFAESQFHALKEYFNNITEKDKHEQIEIIDAALKACPPQPTHGPSESGNPSKHRNPAASGTQTGPRFQEGLG